MRQQWRYFFLRTFVVVFFGFAYHNIQTVHDVHDVNCGSLGAPHTCALGRCIGVQPADNSGSRVIPFCRCNFVVASGAEPN